MRQSSFRMIRGSALHALGRRVSHILSISLAAILLLAASASSLLAQERTGWFNVTWVDPPRGQRPAAPIYGLSDAQGRWTRLEVDADALRAAGGLRALEGKRVTVSGDLTIGAAPPQGISPQTSTLRVRSLRSLDPAPAGPSASISAIGATEVKPYVMLLCSFPDNQDDLYPKSRYETLLGPTRPNMGHYYDEASFGRLSLAGSAVAGWFTLPSPYGFYYPNGGASLRTTELLNDCVAAADASVDFTKYAGIIVQHNVGTGWAYGGKRVLALDGQTRTYGVAWIPRSGPATLAHEIGHTIGFMHSSGGYGIVYDSWWDVMSNANILTDYSLNPPDYVPQHTIAYNKWWAGWIDRQRMLEPQLPSSQSVMLLYADRSPTTAGYQLVRALGPSGSGLAQLAEARRRVGYDQALPGDGVVLHSFDPTRSEPAQVIDVDRNGNPNDASATWIVGESYADSVFGVTIDVDSVNASGFGVTVVRGWRLRMQATGPGGITGSPSGTCTARCDHIAATRGTSIALAAQPGAGAQFLGWSGACSGTGSCTLKLDGNRIVGAAFEKVLPPVVITSVAERRAAVMGAAYADTVRATGGNGAFAWSVSSGSLPPGLSLEPNGVLRGTPAAGGSFHFTATATSDDLSAQREFTLVVTKPVLAAGAVLDALLAGGTALTPDERSFLDLLGNRNGRVDLGDVRAWLVDIKALQADAVPSESMTVLARLGTTQTRARSTTAARTPAVHTPTARNQREARP
jgi:M6 family metalloprotease-like protein